MLTIGVDARAGEHGALGRGRVIRELVRALGARDDGHAYRLYSRERWNGPSEDRLEWRIERSAGLRWHSAVAADAGRTCDVFLADSYLTPPRLRIPVVTLVHDLVAFRLELKAPLRSVVVERSRLAAAVRTSSRLLVPSASTRTALLGRLPGAAAKAILMPLGVPAALLAPPSRLDGVPERFVLAVGLDPRKNVETLVMAFRALPPELRSAHPLVVVGRTSRRTRASVRAVRSLGGEALLLGQVDDGTLAALYRRCTAFCFPSLAEGFGLPVLEAMAAGAAVLASNRPSLPEVGGDAAVYADPDDAAAWSAALAGLLRSHERRAELGRAAQARAASFTWTDAAEIAADALERAAASPQPVRTAPRTADVADERAH